MTQFAVQFRSSVRCVVTWVVWEGSDHRYDVLLQGSYAKVDHRYDVLLQGSYAKVGEWGIRWGNRVGIRPANWALGIEWITESPRAVFKGLIGLGAATTTPPPFCIPPWRLPAQPCTQGRPSPEYPGNEVARGK